MQPDPQERRSPRVAGLSGSGCLGGPAHYSNPIDVFKHAHGGKFTASGNGWRTTCPCCDDKHGALSVTERDGWLLTWCFRCGAERSAILAAVGLRTADIGPPRTWPPSKDERRAWSRAQREAGWSAALAVLALESRVVLIAARELWTVGGLGSVEDGKRLALAVERIGKAANIMCSGGVA